MERWKGMKSKKLFLFTRILDMTSIDINWLNYWKEYFDLTSSGKIDTWDYQWIFAQLLYRRISIFPSHNLIKNIGFTEKATHTIYKESPIAGLPLQSLQFPLVHPPNKKNDKIYEEDYVKNWVGLNKNSIFKIVKTRLLYIPVIARLNRYLKNMRKRNI